MANVDLSIIIPSKNNNSHISEIIKRISSELSELEVEFIVIDMNSSDNSVLWALEEIKKNDLRGCVIQSGGGTISSALNTGIYKSDGKYITFVYPSRLYKNYFSEYLKTADNNAADFVFAVPSQISDANPDAGNNICSSGEKVDPEKLMEELIHSKVYFDFTAVMLKREYLLRNHIKFYEECSFGYVEAFIYNVLLNDPQIACANIVLEKDPDSAQIENAPENVNCYERIDVMLKVFERIKLQRRDNLALTELFEGQKLPAVVLSVVDILLKQGFSYQTVKRSLKQKGYSQYLKANRRTSPELKKKLFRWSFLPWNYGKN
ncbi:MAG: glycosyltransferase [Clostridia bacterium]|nr:glycosyltransferase [Clostridia bacterium]